MAKKLDGPTRLQKAHIWLMGNEETRIYSGIILCGTSTVRKTEVGTAYTDGFNCVYDEAFVDSLNDQEMRALVLHENLHKAYRHRSLYNPLRNKSVRLTNIAMDIYINNHILDLIDMGVDVKLPTFSKETLADIRSYKGKDVPTIFEMLLKKILQQMQKQGKGQPQSGQGQSIDLNADDSLIQEMFKDFIDKADEHDFKGNNSNNPNDPNNPNESEEDKQARKAQQATQDEQLERAVRQAQIMDAQRGKEKGNNSLRGMLEAFEPQVPWQEVLREYMIAQTNARNDSSWAKPNRRFVSSGVYMPTNKSPAMGAIVIAVDTSGSIGDRELGVFLSELETICNEFQPEKVVLLYWGSEVVGHEEYELADLSSLRSSTKPVNGGGTNLETVPIYLNEKGVEYEVAIVFTDGYVGDEWGVWDKPVIFCISSQEEAPASIGETVHVEFN